MDMPKFYLSPTYLKPQIKYWNSSKHRYIILNLNWVFKNQVQLLIWHKKNRKKHPVTFKEQLLFDSICRYFWKIWYSLKKHFISIISKRKSKTLTLNDIKSLGLETMVWLLCVLKFSAYIPARILIFELEPLLIWWWTRYESSKQTKLDLF